MLLIIVRFTSNSNLCAFNFTIIVLSIYNFPLSSSHLHPLRENVVLIPFVFQTFIVKYETYQQIIVLNKNISIMYHAVYS